MTNYRHYVEGGLGVSLASPLEDAVAGAILGDQLFVEKIRGMKISAGLVQQDQPGFRLAQQFGISLGAFSAARQKAAEQLATGGESATQLSLIAEYLQSD